jgi:catechol 2,3-dioxygenase-like lactoylglutathione lyase family enzyme
MTRFDHLAMPVRELAVCRDWYVRVLGLKVEFEAHERRTVAVRDDHDFTIFLHQAPLPATASTFVLYFQVDDVHARYRQLAQQGISFDHEPRVTDWGYGAQLKDPNGYVICLWDEQTMPKTRG